MVILKKGSHHINSVTFSEFSRQPSGPGLMKCSIPFSNFYPSLQQTPNLYQRVHQYLCSQTEIIAFYFFFITTIILNYIALSCILRLQALLLFQAPLLYQSYLLIVTHALSSPIDTFLLCCSLVLALWAIGTLINFKKTKNTFCLATQVRVWQKASVFSGTWLNHAKLPSKPLRGYSHTDSLSIIMSQSLFV